MRSTQSDLYITKMVPPTTRVFVMTYPLNASFKVNDCYYAPGSWFGHPYHKVIACVERTDPEWATLCADGRRHIISLEDKLDKLEGPIIFGRMGEDNPIYYQGTYQEGDVIQVDNGFDCVSAWSVKTLHKDKRGELYFECDHSGHKHKINGQLEENGYYVGMTKPLNRD